jgi:glucan biosynthesis protein C
MQVEHNPGGTGAAGSANATWQRRYDVDWLRTLALGLLIIYHVVVSFQPWAHLILFIQNGQSLEWLWIGMALFNVWRIPLLFVVSGMGVCFAMQRRNWKQLLGDRSLRILLPLVFGALCITPIFLLFALMYYNRPLRYLPHPGHLWFLANIFAYVILLLPLLAYLKNHPDCLFMKMLTRLFRRAWALFLLAPALMLEAWLVNPEHFPAYAHSAHGFWLGLVCFFLGFIFISIKDVFWTGVAKVRHGALALALLLYLVRLLVFRLEGMPNALTGLESYCWLLAVLGYASIYLNRPSDKLAYFSKAVYPVYIIHMPVQFAIARYLLPLDMPAVLKLILLLAGTFGISLLLYEYLLRRLKWIRPLFGMKLRP